MKNRLGWWFPATEEHLPEWMATPKNKLILNGRQAYQGAKQEAAFALCKQFRAAVDVGAHVGLWSYNMAHRFEIVHAFEPVLKHRLCFERNVTLPNVQLYARALGATNGMVNITTGPTSSGDSWVSGEGGIPMDRLDDFDLADVDLLKIDCEGYELNVLKGGEATLIRCRPAVIVEQKPGHAQRFGFKETEAVDYLQSLGAKLRREMAGDYLMSWD